MIEFEAIYLTSLLIAILSVSVSFLLMRDPDTRIIFELLAGFAFLITAFMGLMMRDKSIGLMILYIFFGFSGFVKAYLTSAGFN